MRAYVTYLRRSLIEGVTGSGAYRLWLGSLAVLTVFGLSAYIRQWNEGLAVTGMTDQVSWGLYIANFTFLVGVAAAAVMLVIPAYVYRKKAVREVVLVGELMAIAAIIMCLSFVTADLGRPDRIWHMLPVVGKFHWPVSMLSWDVVVLTGYLLLNMHIPGYLLYRKYQKRPPTTWYYIPFIFISIVWAISIHTVTAFLYNGLSGRPFWNAAIIAPRFLASAFAAGPGLIYIVLDFLQHKGVFPVPEQAKKTLKQIFTVALLINMFLLFSELFKEFYSQSLHVASAQYLWLGLKGYNGLVPWIWVATVLNLAASVILVVPRWARRRKPVLASCAMAFVGIWIEKGPGLVIPGFIPSPLGEMTEYHPTLTEIRICLGIWAMGALLYSILLKASLAIETGRLSIEEPHPTAKPPVEIAKVMARHGLRPQTGDGNF
jgi:molybdopterin-containing oxidoreductase family membrane subunit